MFNLDRKEVKGFVFQLWESDEMKSIPNNWENRHERKAKLLARVNERFQSEFQVAHPADVDKWKRNREWADMHLWDVSPRAQMGNMRTQPIMLWDGENPPRR